MMGFIHEVEDRDDMVELLVDGDRYDIVHDEATGDWLVASDDDPQVQGDWLLTKDDAILYALYQSGVIGEQAYERAPDRKSA
jgi:hypothetical protein